MPQTRFVVLAEFRLKPEGRARFIELARADAQGSVANEPGCRQFDLLLSEEDETLAVLHEVYDSRAAFETHLTMPHYLPFRDGVPDLVTGRSVRFFRQDAG
ncbi:putative quinol monooxygenase [Roseomonas gilardii]|uniref:putative quinol monooxygenase n=1 Tax=Roseomonas gilardii TaxID=257708 RepID=UPI0011A77757|nr:putative quinol monooxygenase [Roseomonas gilardii]